MSANHASDTLGDFDNYQLTVSDDITRICVTGVPGSSETLGMIRFLCSNGLYRRRLVDFRQAPSPFSATELIEFAAHGRALMLDRNRFALLVDDKTQRGPLDILTAYREQTGVSEVAVFDDEQTALDWLSESF
ncbi:MAG: hypothetical protein AAGA33_07075 [Pseudomonadota bacterium]